LWPCIGPKVKKGYQCIWEANLQCSTLWPCIGPKVKQGVYHTVALPFTLKRILRQKKGCGKSNISPCKNMIFKKSSKRNQNILALAGKAKKDTNEFGKPNCNPWAQMFQNLLIS
jgi:hypothetical protein